MKNKLFISCEIHINANEVSSIIKRICDTIKEKEFDMKKYSKDLTDIGIIVNCFRDEDLEVGFGKVRKYINYQKGYADIRLPIPYNEFKNADDNTKYLMVVDNIVKSIQTIEEKCNKSKRAKFDSKKMISDILEKLNVTSEDIKNVNGVLEDNISK